MAVRRAKKSPAKNKKEDPPAKAFACSWFPAVAEPRLPLQMITIAKERTFAVFYRVPPVASATTPRIDCFKWVSILKAIGKWMTVNVVPSLSLH